MIEIVKFDQPLIGYRQNNAVVYASVPTDLSDMEAKQYGYEQVKSALDYEQTQDRPSIDGSDMDAIDSFIPDSPKVKSLKIIGDNSVLFSEGEMERALFFTVEAMDQYGKPISKDWQWTSAVGGELTVTPIDENITVTASADGVTARVDIGVYPYVSPIPTVDEMEVLKARTNALTERADFQDDVITDVIVALYS